MVKVKVLALCTLLFICMTFLQLPKAVHACSCAAPASVQEELKNKASIFSGKVIRIAEPNKGIIRSSADPVKITFSVTNVWKGEKRPEITVQTAVSSASCGYSFEQNKQYLVYAGSDGNGNLQTYICGRTKQLAAAAEDIAVLGAGEQPAAMDGGALQTAGGGSFIGMLVLILTFAVSFFVLFIAIRTLYGIYLTKKYVPGLLEAYKEQRRGDLPSTVSFGDKAAGNRIVPVMLSAAGAAVITLIVYMLLK